MKFVRKIPPTDKVLSERLISEGWKKVKEPKNLLQAILYSIPFMLLGGLIAGLIIWQFYNPFEKISSSNFLINVSVDLKFLGYVLIFMVFTLIHELIHAVFIPNFIKSKNTCLGIRAFGGFVSTTELISRNRFILISLAPFFFLSVVLPLILGQFSLLNGFWAFLIILNAMGSCVDLLNLFLVLIQTRRHSYIISNGFETYFRSGFPPSG